MQISKIQQQNQNKNIQFKNALDSSLRYLAVNQGVGANGVDFTFMVTPRTVSDFAKRSPEAGMETLRREASGTVIDSSIGLFGTAAGTLMAYGLNKKFGLDINRIYASSQTVEALARNKAEQLRDNKTQLEYIKSSLKNIKGYNPNSKNAGADGFVKLSDKTIEEVANLLDKSLTDKIDYGKWIKDSEANARTVIINKIVGDTGAESKYIFESADKKVSSATNLKTFLNDFYIVSDSFNKDKVMQAFKDQLKNGQSVSNNSFIKNLSKFKHFRSAMGFGIASLVGLSVQPLNIYLTKLKTGTDGFVGVEGRSKDDSASFKALKCASGLAFFSMVLASLKMSLLSLVKSPSKFMDKMAFTGKLPTVNQLKGVYGITILSRIAVARDKDELREILTKDTLGFLSWLVLGDIVNKLVADSLDSNVMNYDKATASSKNIFKRAFGATLKTRDEILIKTLADNGVQSYTEINGKKYAKSFSKMLKELKNLTPEIQKQTRKHLRVLNIAQLAGYLFSGAVLGVGIPNLNIYITNMLDKKRKAKLVEQGSNQK